MSRRFSPGLKDRGIYKLLLSGIEAHVCVQQTALDLLAAGWRVYVAVDAVGSRFEIDSRTAIRRMDSSGVTLTTTEAALFEWCREAGTPQFKEISRLVAGGGAGVNILGCKGVNGVRGYANLP